MTLSLLADFNAKGIGNTIHIVSKTGLFPQPQEQGQNTKLDFPALPQRLRSLVNTILERARTARAHGTGWYPIIETLQPNLSFIWSSLTLADRKRFVRYIRPYWELVFAPVPRDLLDLADTMLERGQAVVYGGRIQEIVEGEKGFDVSFFDRTLRATEQLHPAHDALV